MSFDLVGKFEEEVAKFFEAPYAVAVDCCTHAIELCLRYADIESMTIPTRTYISIPLLANKLNISLKWKEEEWSDFYYIDDTNIIDAAVFWKKGGYIQNTFMCLSFQYRKHLNIGRGGMILTDNEKAYRHLKKMSYDGRTRAKPWREQNIDTIGYHYYMTPETAKRGLEKLSAAIASEPKKWAVTDWPDLTKMEIFKK